MHAKPDRFRASSEIYLQITRAVLECWTDDGWNYGDIAGHLAWGIDPHLVLKYPQAKNRCYFLTELRDGEHALHIQVNWYTDTGGGGPASASLTQVSLAKVPRGSWRAKL
jgi:hypothetical protein